MVGILKGSDAAVVSSIHLGCVEARVGSYGIVDVLAEVCVGEIVGRTGRVDRGGREGGGDRVCLSAGGRRGAGADRYRRGRGRGRNRSCPRRNQGRGDGRGRGRGHGGCLPGGGRRDGGDCRRALATRDPVVAGDPHWILPVAETSP